MQAVLTGDIVDSSVLSPEAHRKVIGIVKSAADAFPDAVVGGVDVYGGDSWQMLVPDCGMSLRIALYVRASLKREKDFAIDSRVSVAWGEVDMDQVVAERMSESTGELFTVSGRGLALLKKPARMCFSALPDKPLSMVVDGSFRLLDALVRQWSREQARAIASTLQGKTQVGIAAEFGLSQPAINQSLKAANWQEIEGFMQQLELYG